MAIENVIENASKYSQDHSKVTVKVYEYLDHAVISIEDKGMGIEKHKLAKIYNKFERAITPSTSASKGNGLGLYWSKKIIELHNGSIDVTSEYGVGSKFTILLPIKL